MGSYTKGLFKKGRDHRPANVATPRIVGWHPSKIGQKHKADKGKFKGSCNREACQDAGAIWYNHGTRKYYCWRCARDLNTDPFNRQDAERMFGHPLCTQGEYVEGY